VRAIVVADGDVLESGRLAEAIGEDADSARLVVAADGGAVKALALGLTPDVVVGDGDSLPPERLADLRSAGVEVIVYAPEKDESDTELALREALARGGDPVVITGAFGGERLEHSIANLLLLTLPSVAERDVSLVHGPSVVRVIGVRGMDELTITGEAGDYVSLLPLTEVVDGVTTTGLRYPLDDATLEQGSTRGLSNELLGKECLVRTASGRLAVIHTSRAELSQ
jgi:thiamine pyrophosphokinase